MGNVPLAVAMPGAMANMEAASNELWTALRKLSVEQLKALRPTGEYVKLIDALIDVRMAMDRVVAPRDFRPRTL